MRKNSYNPMGDRLALVKMQRQPCLRGNPFWRILDRIEGGKLHRKKRGHVPGLKDKQDSAQEFQDFRR